MFLRRLSIQWKITLLAGLCLLTIVVLLVATSLFQAKRSAVQVFQANTELLDQSARLRLQAHAESQALRVQRYFMDAYQYGNGFARLVQALRQRGGEDLRAELVKQARQALAGNPDLIGLYRCSSPTPWIDRTPASSARMPAVATISAATRSTGPSRALAPSNPRSCLSPCWPTPAPQPTDPLQPLADLPSGDR